MHFYTFHIPKSRALTLVLIVIIGLCGTTGRQITVELDDKGRGKGGGDGKWVDEMRKRRKVEKVILQYHGLAQDGVGLVTR